MSFQKKSNIAIIMIALLVIGNQIFIQYWLSEKKYDAKVINVSGRQRMLSQRTMALAFDYELLQIDNIAKVKELESTFEEWENAHHYLISGNSDLEIKGASKSIKASLEKLTPTIDFTKKILKNIGNLNKTELTILEKNQTSFLVGMNQIVKDFEEESNDKFYIMILLQFVFSLVIIFVIIFELKFVFQPIAEGFKRQNKALKSSNKILEEYAYIASHDLRSPLQNMLNFLGLLKKTAEPKFDNKEKVYYKYIEESADRMNQTTIDLLHYSTSNDVKIKTTNVDILFQSVLDDLKTIIDENAATINIGELPAKIEVDENLFRLLIQNLMTNAMKFIPKGKTAKIDISCTLDKHQYVFCIQDNGIGISKENTEKIFKIFKRLHTQKEYKGTGIGLSMCKRIIEGHHGEIWVESELGEGSRFYFSIPKV